MTNQLWAYLLNTDMECIVLKIAMKFFKNNLAETENLTSKTEYPTSMG